MKKPVILIVVVAVIILVITMLSGTDEPLPEAEGDLDRVFSLTFMDLSGGEVTLKEHLGTPLVVNSWASWCPFCEAELPDFAQVQDEHKGEVVFIAINRRESVNISKDYIDERELEDKMIFWQDDDDTFYRAIEGFAMPETIFIDASGRVIERKRGVMDYDEVKRKTQALIKG